MCKAMAAGVKTNIIDGNTLLVILSSFYNTLLCSVQINRKISFPNIKPFETSQFIIDFNTLGAAKTLCLIYSDGSSKAKKKENQRAEKKLNNGKLHLPYMHLVVVFVSFPEGWAYLIPFIWKLVLNFLQGKSKGYAARR